MSAQKKAGTIWLPPLLITAGPVIPPDLGGAINIIRCICNIKGKAVSFLGAGRRRRHKSPAAHLICMILPCLSCLIIWAQKTDHRAADPETEDVLDRAAHSSEGFDKTHNEEDTYHDANPGIGETQGEFGSASFRECLGRLVQPSATTSATCHSGEA